jgi:hypothetical protein
MIALANERGCTADDLLQEQLDRLNEDSAFSESYICVVNLHFVPLRAAAAIRNHRSDAWLPLRPTKTRTQNQPRELSGLIYLYKLLENRNLRLKHFWLLSLLLFRVLLL